MKTNKMVRGLAALATVAAMAFAGTAVAKEGASGKKARVEPVIDVVCQENGIPNAWLGLTYSMWNAVNTETGERWTFKFDDKGRVTYTRNGGAQVKTSYLQPLRIYNADNTLLLDSAAAQPGATGVIAASLTHCTMIWYTTSGPLFMTRT
jgi:hypothetical protein